MAALVEYENGRVAYPAVVAAVLHLGVRRSPRGLDTFDMGPTTVVLHSPYDAMPLGVGRDLKPAIGAAEAAQLIAGNVEHSLLPRVSPAFRQFLEPSTGRFHGAYGDRIGSQITHVVRKLRDDPDSRQAVVTLWDPDLDNEPNRRDYPCTVALNFAVVNKMLELRVQMRSNDVWLGFPYDIFMFTQLQLTVARALGVEPGPYTHSAWSLHLYAKDVERAQALTLPERVGSYQPTGFGLPGEDWDVIRCRAVDVLTGQLPNFIRPLTESEVWYVKQLAPYLWP